MKKMIAILSIAAFPLFADGTPGQEEPQPEPKDIEVSNLVALDDPQDVEKPKDPEPEISQLIALDNTDVDVPSQEPKPQEPENTAS